MIKQRIDKCSAVVPILFALLFAWLFMPTSAFAQVPQGETFGGGTSTWGYTPNFQYTAGSDVFDIVTAIGPQTADADGDGSFWGIRDIESAGQTGGTSQDHILDFNSVTMPAAGGGCISFSYYVEAFDNGDDLFFQATAPYNSGGATGTVSTNQVPVFTGSSGNGTGGAWVTYNITVLPGITSVDFDLVANQNGGSDYAGFDNVGVVAGACATADYTIEPPPPPQPNVSIAKTVTPTSASPGDVVTWTIYISNTNNITATNGVTITETPDLSLYSVDSITVDGAPIAATTNPIVINPFDAGDDATIVIVSTIDAGISASTIAQNTVEITTTGDITTTDNTSTATVLIDVPVEYEMLWCLTDDIQTFNVDMNEAGWDAATAGAGTGVSVDAGLGGPYQLDVFTLDPVTGLYIEGQDGVIDIILTVTAVVDAEHLATNSNGTGNTVAQFQNGTPNFGNAYGFFQNVDTDVNGDPNNANWSYAKYDFQFVNGIEAQMVADGFEIDWSSVNGSTEGYEIGFATVNGAGNGAIEAGLSTATGVTPGAIDWNGTPTTFGSNVFGTSPSADGGNYATGVYGADFVNAQVDPSDPPEPQSASGALSSASGEFVNDFGVPTGSNVTQFTWYSAYSAIAYTDAAGNSESNSLPLGGMTAFTMAVCEEKHPDVTVEKTAAPNPASPGDEVIWTVTVSNTTAITTMHGITVTDTPIDTFYQITGASMPFTTMGGTYEFVLPDLGPNDATSFVITSTVYPTATVGDILTNTVVITTMDDITDTNNAYTATVPITVESGTLVINKVTVPAGSTDAFTITTDISGAMPMVISDGGSITITDVPSGTYSFTETVPSADWLLSGVSATFDADNLVTLSNGVVGDIDVTAGMTTVVTITNTRSFGTLIFEKITDPVDDSAVFTITHDVELADGTVGGSFPLTSGMPVTVTDVVAGLYTFSEDDGDYNLDNVVCNTGGDETGVQITGGITTTCTLTNIQVVTPTITIDKESTLIDTTLTYTITVENISTVDATIRISDQMTGIQANYCLGPDDTVIAGDDALNAAPADQVQGFSRTGFDTIPAGDSIQFVCVATYDPFIGISKDADQMINSGDDATFTINISGTTNNTNDDLNAVRFENVTVSDPATPQCETGDNGNVPLILGSQGFSAFGPIPDTCSATNVTSSFTNTIEISADIAFTNTVEAAIIDPMTLADIPGTVVSDTVTFSETITDSDSAMVTVITPVVPGTLIFVKVTDPVSDTTAFEITHDVNGGGTFDLTSALPVTVTDVLSGTYTFSETNLPTNWEQVSASCGDAGDGNGVQVTAGMTTTCTITNEYTPPTVNMPDFMLTKTVGIDNSCATADTLGLTAAQAMAGEPTTINTTASGLLITAVLDGPLSGGTPKVIELYAIDAIADLSLYGVGSANNGGGSTGEEFTFPTASVAAGDFIYVATDAASLSSYGITSANVYTTGAAAINGDDAIELFMSGTVIDTFGDINTDGTGEAWEYLDGWAYRVSGTNPSATFNLADYTYSGINVVDGTATAAEAGFMAGSFSTTGMITAANVYYCYTVTNTGNITLTDHTLIDDQIADTGLTNVAYDLAPGAVFTYIIPASVTTDTVNTADWVADGITRTDVATVTTDVTPVPGIDIEKVSTLNGNSIEYTVYVTNTGDVAATYLITDVANTPLLYNGMVYTDLITITADIAPMEVVSYTMSATVDPSVIITTTAQTSSVVAGSPALFDVNIGNDGDVVIEIVEIVDPEGVCGFTTAGLYLQPGDSLPCNSNPVSIPTGSAPVTHTIEITASAVLINQVLGSIVGYDDTDSDTTFDTIIVTNSSQDVVTVTIPVTPTVVIDKVSEMVGTTLTYTVYITNVSSVDTRVRVDDRMAGIAAYCYGGAGEPIGPGDVLITVSNFGWYADVAAGETITFVCTMTVDPQITVSKTPDTQNVMAGDDVTFTVDIEASNYLTSAIQFENVTINDPQTPSCEAGNFTGDVGLGSFSDSYTCTATDVAADFTNVITVSADIAFSNAVTVSIDGVPGSMVTDTVAFTMTVSDTDSAEVTVEVTTPVDMPDFTLVKTVGMDNSCATTDSIMLTEAQAMAGEPMTITTAGSGLMIVGVLDGPLSGGTPKVIELYAIDAIADLSMYAIESANNGGTPDVANGFVLTGTASAGQTLYVASDAVEFANFFGFAPDFVTGEANINGDDAIVLYSNGVIVDAFGAVGTDGTGEAWEHTDGWAYRMNGASPSMTFNLNDWTFSGTDALDGTAVVGDSAYGTGSFSTTGMMTAANVFYCYTVTNTGNVTLTNHTLVDDQIADTGLTDVGYDLVPGAVFTYVIATSITTDTVNTADWIADGITRTDMATVTIEVETVVEPNPSIALTKTVGTEAGVCASTDDILVEAGTTVYYCYTVTNTGDITLSVHDLDDDVLGGLLAGFSYDLAPGASVSTVDAGAMITMTAEMDVMNTAIWTADGITATDTANVTVFRNEPAISLVKTVGTDMDACASTDDITVQEGTTVYYCYTVTNIGDITLSTHALTDDILGDLFDGVAYDLAVGESASTVGLGVMVSSTMTADTMNTAVWTADGVTATATANVNVTPNMPSISLVKTVGTDANACASTDDITVDEGTMVYYCYTVTNTGNVILSSHDLDDDVLGELFTGLAYDLAPGASVSTVDAGVMVTMTAAMDVMNTAIWTADGVTASDTANVNVTPNMPSISLVKTVGTEAGTCASTDNILVEAGTTVYYCYTVTNTGNVTLSSHDLDDDVLGELFAGLAYDLAPGASVSTVDAGVMVSSMIDVDTMNTAIWTADGITASDMANVMVYRNEPAISLLKTVGTDMDACATTTDITVDEGTTVYYCYTVTNTGNVTLSTHALTDDVLGDLFAGVAYDLVPGESASTVGLGVVVSSTMMADTMNTAIWTADGITATAAANVNVNPLGTIGNQLWSEVNGNAIYEPGLDVPIAGVVVYLSDLAGNVISTTTNANGRYSFTGLPLQTYIVSIDTSTLPDDKRGYEIDANPDNDGNNSATVDLTAGNISDLTQDFSFAAPTAVGLANAGINTATAQMMTLLFAATMLLATWIVRRRA